MKKLLLGLTIVLLLSTCFLTVSAQQLEITGLVSSATDNQPLIGVTVQVANTSTGTTTDAEGHYSIRAEKGAVIVFSYVGFQSQKITVGAETTYNVKLQPSAHSLEQLVVVGYGTQKEENLTGAVTSVDVAVLDSRPIPDVARGLQGVVPGLSIQIPDGEVGSTPIMKIRGQIGSLYGSSSPLILVDNVEVPSIQFVNPNNIESITVLKDAASSSIYGSKAAFGVILITTKKGTKTNGSEITYSSNFSWQTPFKDIDIAGIDGIEYTLEAHENMKGSGPAGGFWRIDRESFARIKQWQQLYGGQVSPGDPVIYNRDWYYEGGEKFGVRIYDPVEMMVKDVAFSQKHNLGLRGKSDNTRYNLNLGYLDKSGMMKPAEHDDFRRLTANLHVSTKVNSYLTIRGGAMYADDNKRYPNALQSFAADPWLYLYRWSRLFPTGSKEHGEEIRDPYWMTKNANTAKNRERYLKFDVGATIDINQHWDVKVDYAYSSELNSFTSSKPTWKAKLPWYKPIDWLDEEGNQIYVDSAGNIVASGGDPAYEFPVTDVTTKNDSYFYQSSYASQRHTVNAYSTYRLNLNDKHAFKLMLGTNIEAFKWNSHWSDKTGLINNDNPQFNFAVGTETVGGGANWNSQLGYFGRLNYAFDDKYLLEANLRYDATSKFPADLRWRWYPSFSGGWVLSREHFMEGLNPIFSFAKIRGSWGLIGDQSVPNSLYLATMDVDKNSWLSGNGEQFFQLGTPDPISAGITWQDIEQLNIGTNLRFFDNRLGVTFDWFQRYTRNMIIPGDDLPATYGTDAPDGNYGNLRTRGWEVSANYTFNFDNGLFLRVHANLSDATTLITKSADWKTPWKDRDIHDTYSTGKRYGDIYGYITDRLYQKEDFVYDEHGNFVQTTIVYDGTAKVTNKQAGENPVYQTYFEDGNQILLISPGDVKFVDVNRDGYITPGKNTFGDPGDQVVIGNSTPRYQYGFRLDAGYKTFDFSIFVQGVGERSIWGSGQLAIPGFFAKEGAMPEAIASNFWKEDRTDAFYPRAWNLGGANQGYVMRPQTRYMLNMAYMRIKNITLGYSLPENILKSIHLSNARIYVSIENWFNFDNLRGLPINPEAISGYSILRDDRGYNLGRTGTSNPAFKSASMGIQITL